MTENFGKGKNKEHLYRIPKKENAGRDGPILPGGYKEMSSMFADQ